MGNFKVLVLVFVFARPAFAEARSLSFGKPVLAPMNAVIFCQSYPADCAATGASGPHASLTNAQLGEQLREVNQSVNAGISADEDKRGDPGIDKWLISPSRGNCADYAVTKRHELLGLGWPSSSLLLADLTIPDGAGHTVLIVRSPMGDLVLDSLRPDIRAFSQVPYNWLKVQSPIDPNFWVTIAR
ncbi:MAG: transglutaminase-like cysteine peptidase [Bdellovibrionota bacterium]